jgi:hypothetical protein
MRGVRMQMRKSHACDWTIRHLHESIALNLSITFPTVSLLYTSQVFFPCPVRGYNIKSQLCLFTFFCVSYFHFLHSSRTMESRKLFTPLQVGNMSLSHRVVMCPLTRTRCPNSLPTPLVAEYYSQRATPGGLLISEGVMPSFMVLFPPLSAVFTSLTILE